MGKITFTGELDFLEKASKMKKEAYHTIHAALVLKNTDIEKKDEYKHLSFIAFSRLNTWSIPITKSDSLLALSEKIYHMIFHIGCPQSVKLMLEKIASGRIKSFCHPVRKDYRRLYPKGHSQLSGEHLGRGHFRWNFKSYVLNSHELETVRNLVKNL